MLNSLTLNCPYCGEPNEVEVDPSAGDRQDYVEDCQVCCRPWNVKVRVTLKGHVKASLSAQDDVEGEE